MSQQDNDHEDAVDVNHCLLLRHGPAASKEGHEEDDAAKDDEDYGDVITAPAKRNEAINRIISRLRPTYSKRPRERYDRYKVCIYVFTNLYELYRLVKETSFI